MNIESRLTIHAGANFVFAPPPQLDKESILNFQKLLDEYSVEITHIEYRDEGFVAIRQPKMPLQITVGTLNPQVGQLLIVAPTPGRPLDTVDAEAEDVAEVFNQVWPDERRQVIACDVTIRDLYNTSSEHAFKELWESRLRQTPDSLARLGPGLLGGGLRFVLPPSGEDNHIAEVKIESYLQDTSKLFIEVQFKWVQGPLSSVINPTERLELVNNYISNQVVEFIREGG